MSIFGKRDEVKVGVDGTIRRDYRWEPIPDPPYAAQKSDGQVAHETFHAKLAELGVTSRGGWATLAIERKAAWEAAAKALRDREFLRHVWPEAGFSKVSGFTKHEGPYKFDHSHGFGFVGFDPGRDDGSAVVHFKCADSKLAQAREYFKQRLQEVRNVIALSDESFGQRLQEVIGEKMDKSDELQGANTELETLRDELADAREDVSVARQEVETLKAKCKRLERELADQNRLDAGERNLLRHELFAGSSRAVFQFNAATRIRKQRDEARAELKEELTKSQHNLSAVEANRDAFMKERDKLVAVLHHAVTRSGGALDAGCYYVHSVLWPHPGVFITDKKTGVDTLFEVKS